MQKYALRNFWRHLFTAQTDLALELQKLGKRLPPKMLWQFDNCGENKVLFCIIFHLLLNEEITTQQNIEQNNVHLC